MSADNIRIYHRDMVERLKKSGDVIESQMTGFKCDLLHGTIGVCGESGELLDAVKKHVVYNKPLNRDNMIEELGDIEFYLEMVRQTLDLDREAILQANIDKLEKRYGTGTYSDAQAHARADKT